MAKNKKQNKRVQFSPQNYIRTKGRSLPIHECLINSDWEETGLAQIIVCRESEFGKYIIGGFLVDTYCLGVKDAFYKFNVTENFYKELKAIFERYDGEVVPYDLVHNIIYGGIEFAEEFGISPSPEFTFPKYLLEEDTDAIPLMEINLGVDDEPMLIVKTQDELNKYLPILQRTVPDIKYRVKADDRLFDEDYDDEQEDGEELFEQLKDFFLNEKAFIRYEKHLELIRKDIEKREAMIRSIYQYQNPEYPESINLENQLLKELFNPEHNQEFDPAIIRNILLCERESLIQDLENLAIYEIGRTYPIIRDEGGCSMDFALTIQHTVLFLAELGSPKSMEVILQIFRQDKEFFEYHFGDWAEEILSPAIFKLGINQLPKLLDFMKEPGLEAINKGYILKAVTAVGIKYPERRQEVIVWYRDLMNFYIDNLENNLVYDGELSGIVISELMDLKAEELLPEIKKMVETDQVFTYMKSYEDVADEILGFGEPYTSLQVLTIYDWYKSLEY